MKLVLVTVGSSRGPLREAIEEFGRRARRYWKLEEIEVAAGGKGGKAAPADVLALEGERVLRRIADGLEIAALTRGGDEIDSPALARWLGDHAVRGSEGVAFVIGGAFGLAPEVLAAATRTISLSRFTVPHDFARAVLLEQLYRAGTILRGEPYHKG